MIEKGSRSGSHIFGEPDEAIRGDDNADAHAVQGRAEKVDAVPAADRLILHTVLNSGDTRPGRAGWSCLADILSAVAQAGKALVSDALAG